MIQFYQFPGAWGLSSASPFCIKLETYFRMTQTPYNTHIQTDFSKAPKGKVPYIEDKEQKIGDSGLIIDYLTANYGIQLPDKLSPQEKAIERSMLRLIEEHLYWVMVYSRWGDADNFQVLKEVIFAGLPGILKPFIPKIARKQVLQNVRAHGMGRHTPEEIYDLGNSNITALSDFLQDKPFFFGKSPSILDASAYGLLVSILKSPIESPLKAHTSKCQNLVDFCKRIEDKYYGEQLDA